MLIVGAFPSLAAATDTGGPYVNIAVTGFAGLGLIILFTRALREQGREYRRVKAERDECEARAAREKRETEELVDRLVGALRLANVAVPWGWKHTPPEFGAAQPRPESSAPREIEEGT